MNRTHGLQLADYLGHMLEAVERCLDHVGGMNEAAFLALPHLRTLLPVPSPA